MDMGQYIWPELFPKTMAMSPFGSVAAWILLLLFGSVVGRGSDHVRPSSVVSLTWTNLARRSRMKALNVCGPVRTRDGCTTR